MGKPLGQQYFDLVLPWSKASLQPLQRAALDCWAKSICLHLQEVQCNFEFDERGQLCMSLYGSPRDARIVPSEASIFSGIVEKVKDLEISSLNHSRHSYLFLFATSDRCDAKAVQMLLFNLWFNGTLLLFVLKWYLKHRASNLGTTLHRSISLEKGCTTTIQSMHGAVECHFSESAESIHVKVGDFGSNGNVTLDITQTTRSNPRDKLLE